MKDQVQTILKRAAKECVYTKRGNNLITPSRAGQLLLTQVLELIVLPKLPQPQSSERLPFNSVMSIAQGYVYESALYDELCDTYGAANVEYQVPTTYGELQGTADFVVTTEHEIIVIDAKAVNVGTKRELLERKIGTDNWSYRTQLAIYVKAIEALEGEKNSGRKVRGEWYCWSPGVKKQWVVKLPSEEVNQRVDATMWRIQEFKKVQALMDEGRMMEAAALACQDARELILPKDFYFGRPCASKSFDYNPYAELFYYDMSAADEEEDDGFPIEKDLLEQVTFKLMVDSCDGVMLPYEQYLSELNVTFS